MTYAEQGHIEGELKGISFGSDALITDVKLQQMLEEADAEINSYINGRYVLPITDANALLFLRKLEIDLIVYRVTKILEIKEARPVSDNRVLQDVSHASTYRIAINTLKDIRDGKMQLEGAELKTTTGQVKSYNQTNNVEHQFKMDKQQW